MKILILTGDYQKNNANSNCVKNLIQELEKNHNISVISIDASESYSKDGMIDVYTIADIRGKRFYDEIKYINGLFNRFNHLLKKAVCKYFRKLRPDSWEIDIKVSTLIDKVTSIVEENQIECVISVCMPIISHCLAYKIKKQFSDIKWIAYYLDPYTFSIYNSSINEAMNIENRLLKYADNIAITQAMYAEFKTCKLNQHLKKSIVCEFPIVKDKSKYFKNTIVKFDGSKINCVFVGYLYPSIRDPRFFLDMLAKTDSKIKFYILGGVYGDASKLELDKYKTMLGERLILIDVVSLDEAFRVMNDADVLINIGNSNSNQLPSKIFDYISTGKPIVNIYKTLECPSVEYMEKYPLALNIYEGNGISEECVNQFESFCIKTKDNLVEFGKVKELYKNSTPEYVASQFDDILRGNV